MEATFKQRQDKLRKALKPLLSHYPPPSREHFLKMNLLDLFMYTGISPDPFDPNAGRIFNRLKAEYVDWNEVRVTSSHELGEILRNYRLKTENAHSIKNTAQTIFYKENRLNLDFLSTGNPSDVKKYILLLSNFPQTQCDLIMILLTDEADIPPTPQVRWFSQRIGFLLEDATDNAARLIYKKTVPASQAFHAFYAICKHTQSICRQDGPHCQACFLNRICDYGISKVGKK